MLVCARGITATYPLTPPARWGRQKVQFLARSFLCHRFLSPTFASTSEQEPCWPALHPRLWPIHTWPRAASGALCCNRQWEKKKGITTAASVTALTCSALMACHASAAFLARTAASRRHSTNWTCRKKKIKVQLARPSPLPDLSLLVLRSTEKLKWRLCSELNQTDLKRVKPQLSGKQEKETLQSVPKCWCCPSLLIPSDPSSFQTSSGHISDLSLREGLQGRKSAKLPPWPKIMTFH